MLQFTVSVKHGWIIFISPNSKNGLRHMAAAFNSLKNNFSSCEEESASSSSQSIPNRSERAEH